MILPTLADRHKCRIFLVGAGGIGCEVLKNLVLSEIGNVDVIDLDTIDFSNLNRQFLFHREHVGKAKSQIAVETARVFNPKSNLAYLHGSVMNSDYDVNFFKKYDIVLNALDNAAARSHVNRMCLAADVPLVESGSSGAFGQTTVIKKGVSECYECLAKPVQKTFPGCTIRNTPSEPIHCVVWSKHLFNQLFGEADPDEDVSPDMADPELQEPEAQQPQNIENGNNDESSSINNTENTSDNGNGNIERVSTRLWAQENDYDPKVLFKKLFVDDINYLLSMENLWKKRTPPVPVTWDDISDEVIPGASASHVTLNCQRLWSLSECKYGFSNSVKLLQERVNELPEGNFLAWDKDDEAAMDFVVCCSNIRSHIFGIVMKTRFEIKSMAGNIIPAVASTNAIVAGAVVLEAFKLINNRIDLCKSSVVQKSVMARGRVITTGQLCAPNPKCYVCSPKCEVYVKLNVKTTTLAIVEDKILKQRLHMVSPDVEIAGKGMVLISSEPGETPDLDKKKLIDFDVRNGAVLECDDFHQVLKLNLIIVQCDDLPKDTEFEILTDISELKAEQEPLLEKGELPDDGIEMVPAEPEKPKKRSLEKSDDEELNVEEKRRKMNDELV